MILDLYRAIDSSPEGAWKMLAAMRLQRIAEPSKHPIWDAIIELVGHWHSVLGFDISTPRLLDAVVDKSTWCLFHPWADTSFDEEGCLICQLFRIEPLWHQFSFGEISKQIEAKAWLNTANAQEG